MGESAEERAMEHTDLFGAVPQGQATPPASPAPAGAPRLLRPERACSRRERDEVGRAGVPGPGRQDAV